MDKAFDRAAEKVAGPIVTFVEAADRLVNLLTEDTHSMTAAAVARHKDDVERAMNAYDVARRELTGEDVSSA